MGNHQDFLTATAQLAIREGGIEDGWKAPGALGDGHAALEHAQRCGA